MIFKVHILVSIYLLKFWRRQKSKISQRVKLREFNYETKPLRDINNCILENNALACRKEMRVKTRVVTSINSKWFSRKCFDTKNRSNNCHKNSSHSTLQKFPLIEIKPMEKRLQSMSPIHSLVLIYYDSFQEEKKLLRYKKVILSRFTLR